MKTREELKGDATRAFTPEERARRERKKKYAAMVASTDREELRSKWRDEYQQRIANKTPAELEEFREKRRAYHKEYYQRNAEQVKERTAQRRIDKADEIAEYDKKYRVTHKAERAAYDKQRRLADPERHRENNRRWRANQKAKKALEAASKAEE